MLRHALLFLPIFLPFYLVRFKIGPFPTTLLEIATMGLVIWFTWETRGKGWREGWRRLGYWRWPAATWAVATLIAVFASPNLWTGLGLWRAYILEPLAIFFMMHFCIREEKDAELLKKSLFLSVFFVVAWGVVQFLTGKNIPYPWDVSLADGRRATGPFPYPNALALFIAPIGAWAFALWIEQRARLFYLATAIIALIGILIARSDGGLIAFGSVALLTLSWDRKTRKLAVLFLFFSGFLLLFSHEIRQRVFDVLFFREWSGRVRLFMWRETWDMIKAHPFFGAGFGGYPIVFAPFHKATFIEIFQYPHNILLNFWSETGLLGIAAFTWICATWFHHAPRITRHVSSIIPLLVILIHGLVDVPYFKNDLAMAFWLLIFLTTTRFDRQLISG